jgi:hypothetical protein
MMNSVERIEYYAEKLEVEDALLIDEDESRDSELSSVAKGKFAIPMCEKEAEEGKGKGEGDEEAPGGAVPVVDEEEGFRGMALVTASEYKRRVLEASPPENWPATVTLTLTLTLTLETYPLDFDTSCSSNI